MLTDDVTGLLEETGRRVAGRAKREIRSANQAAPTSMERMHRCNRRASRCRASRHAFDVKTLLATRLPSSCGRLLSREHDNRRPIGAAT